MQNCNKLLRIVSEQLFFKDFKSCMRRNTLSNLMDVSVQEIELKEQIPVHYALLPVELSEKTGFYSTY